MKNFYPILYLVVAVSFVSCSEEKKKFRLVPSSESGITFRNVLTPTLEFNILNYMYFYNGGGVAAGDFNGDQLPDIYFTSNQESNKLYLNKGDFKFADVTEESGVAGLNGWATGVTTADVNSDGRLDIYVGYLGDYLIYQGKNQLFINEGNDENGVPKFVDRAVEYGLDLVGFATQAAFFDYDRDGDLDMFMLNHSLHEQGTFGKTTLRNTQHPLAGDKLFKNDNGRFLDVTLDAGIYSSVLGYGLGVGISDINLDGWPDIYVGNDFHENDYLYLNQQNGTFKEEIEKSMNHTSRFTMGVDLADFNNDGFPDIISTDMLPYDPKILKASAAEDPYDIYMFKIGFGYNHQFARNNLQVNNHDGTFSEIALLAGVSATDWSWSALFADLDLDGAKDIFIANGIPRRPNDLDYINFVQNDSIQHKMEMGLVAEDLLMIEKMPKIKVANFLFANNGDSTFSDKAEAWGLAQPSYSNSVAYADFDNDGDLDLVVNNLEDEAFLYENNTLDSDSKDDAKQAHYLKIALEGTNGNRLGVGAKVYVYNKSSVQMQECSSTRGFLSAVDHKLIFGIPENQIDSLLVIWNDGAYEKLSSVNTDQTITLRQENAAGTFDYQRFHVADPILIESTTDLMIDYKHEENAFTEFTRESLIPHMISAEGPAVAIGDINKDGFEDIFLGGGKWQPGQIYFQNPNGNFKPVVQEALLKDSTYEDVDALFFDANGDTHLDLFVVSGGNEWTGKSEYRTPRLYLNNGKGKFERSKSFSDIFITGSCVSAGDVDGDGDLDLFLGSRAVPWKYGIKADSYVFQNDGSGSFVDVTAEVAPALRQFGLVKDALWADLDGNQQPDLVIAAEWGPISILMNKSGKLTLLNPSATGLENTNGWWNAVDTGDFDKDGDLDLVFGNLGLNSKLKASQTEPVRLYVSDFDDNERTDQVLTHYLNGIEYPFYTRDELTKQMPFLKKKYLSYSKFANASMQDVFPPESLMKAEQSIAYTFESSIVENLGGGKFKVIPLPRAAQFSSVNSVLVDDLDGDKLEDILIGGNSYRLNIQMGRNDASYGLILKGDGKGNFKALTPVQSGLSINGEVRSLRKIKIGGKNHFLGIRNNDTIKSFTKNK